VPDGDDSVRENLIDKDGIVAGMRDGAIHIGTSTVTPKATTEFANLHAEQGSHYLAATFAGHPEHAATGKLISFVAGQQEILERCRPVLDAYTAKLIVLGEDPALAASLKLTVNFFAACLLETMGETLVLAEGQGLNLEVVSGMLKELLQHPALAKYLDKIRLGNFEEVWGVHAGRCRLEGRSPHLANGCGGESAITVWECRAGQNHRGPSAWLGTV
jgi:3-hydroxyisobutyrate dehydrogenase-like beta-hydroxyacid dehydrogenase